MIEITVRQEESGIRLDRFLERLFPEAPISFWYKAFRKNQVKIDGKHTKELKTRLSEGSLLQFYFSDEQIRSLGYQGDQLAFAKSNSGFPMTENPVETQKVPNVPQTALRQFRDSILYEDANILVINKPEGALVQQSKGNKTSLTEIALVYLQEQNDSGLHRAFQPAFCHRLDRNTGGVLVMAKTLEASRQISYGLKSHEIEKEYLALIEGEAHCWKEETQLQHCYRKDSANNKAVIQPYDPSLLEQGYQRCALTVQLCDVKEGQSLVKVHLLTGRSHQIRAQLSFEGYPILGDVKYGSRGAGKRETHQRLFAWAVTFHGLTEDLAYLNGKRIEAPVPPDMAKFLEKGLK